MAGQIEILELAKTNLDQSLSAMKKEHRRELSIKDEEMENLRISSQKKIKILEQELEDEHDERLQHVRDKHELEQKVTNLQELAARAADEEQVMKLRKDLKRTKALLKDAQASIETAGNDSSNKVVLKQLRNQVRNTYKSINLIIFMIYCFSWKMPNTLEQLL